MSDKNEFYPQLTRKEMKLIKLLRIQNEETQKRISDNIENSFNQWIENKRENNTDNEQEADYKEAYWLNSDYYKK